MEPHDGPDDDTRPASPDDARTGDAEPAASTAPAAPAESAALAEPAEPAAPITGSAPTTGNRSVAAARDELATVAQRPLAEHPDAFARVHAGLQQALSDIDDA